jgi:hypothetical protein
LISFSSFRDSSVLTKHVSAARLTIN